MATICLFCKKVIAAESPVVVYKDEAVVAFLDAYPRTRGHLIVAPVQHCETIHQTSYDVHEAISRGLRAACDSLVRFGAAGINLGSNVGKVAGQQVPHFHWHVIPRYEKDDAEEIEPAFKDTPWRQKSITLSAEETSAIASDLRRIFAEEMSKVKGAVKPSASRSAS